MNKRFYALLLVMMMLCQVISPVTVLADGTEANLPSELEPVGPELEGEPEDEPIEEYDCAGKHTYTEWVKDEETGKHTRYCIRCSYGAEEHEASGDWVEVTPAKCGVEGLQSQTCETCGLVAEDSIPALEHEPEEGDLCEDDYVAPTCIEPGRQYIHCKNIVNNDKHLIKPDENGKWVETDENDPYFVIVDENAHDWKSYAAENDCTIGQWPAYSQCTLCGKLAGDVTEDQIKHAEEGSKHGELYPDPEGEKHTCAELPWTPDAELSWAVDGYCTICNKLVVEKVQITIKHNWVKQPDSLPETCDAKAFEEGKYYTGYYICENDGCEAWYVEEYLTLKDMKEHTPIWTNGTSGNDCELPGRTSGTYCSVCGVGVGDNPSQIIEAGQHDWVYGEKVEDTCTDVGYAWVDRTCSVCGKYEEGTPVNDIAGHDFSIRVKGEAASCTEPGKSMNMKCSRCGELQFTDDQLYIAPHGHSYEDGYYPEKIKYTDALTEYAGTLEEWLSRAATREYREAAHDNCRDYWPWTDVEDTYADCENDGVIHERFCAFCGETINGEDADEELLEKLGLQKAGEEKAWGHKYNKRIEGKRPTCTEGGVSDSWGCVNEGCDEVLEGEDVAPLGHNFSKHVELKLPGCYETAEEEAAAKGVAAYTYCDQCGLVICEEQEITHPALNNKVIFNVAKLTEETSGIYMPEEGHPEDFIIPAYNHEYEKNPGDNMELMDEVKATCVDTGREAGAYRCLICGDVFNEVATRPLGHKVWSVAKAEPDCINSGCEAYVGCERCGKIALGVLTEDDLETEENENNESEIQAALTASNFFLPEEGSPADVYEEFYIKANGHTEVNGTEVPATCYAPGTTAGKYCSVCGVSTVGMEPIEQLTHHYVLKDAKVDATCTTDGKEELWICDQPNAANEGGICGHECEEEGKNGAVIPKLGHSAKGTYIAPKDPTCDEYGYTYGIHCSQCMPEDGEIDYTLVLAFRLGEDDSITGEDLKANGWLFTPDIIDPLGHTYEREGWNGQLLDTPKSCTEVWYEDYAECDECDAFTGKKNDPYNHADAFLVTDRTGEKLAPTCDQPGYTGNVLFCPDCHIYIGETEPALNHKHKTHTDANDAKCYADGNFAYDYCPDCETYFIDKGEEGIVTSKNVEDTIDKNRPAHDFTEHVDAVRATCKDDGCSSGNKCANEGCEEVACEIIEANAEVFHAWIKANQEQAIAEGYAKWVEYDPAEEDEFGTQIPASGLKVLHCACCEEQIDIRLFPDIPIGDVNVDGYVDSEDAVMILKYTVGLLDEDDFENFSVADCDDDGVVDSADALYCLKQSVM